MSLIENVKARLAPTSAEATARTILSGDKSLAWLDEKMDAIAARRATMVDEVDDLMDAAVTGDEAAYRKAEKLDADRAKLDAEIKRLSDAKVKVQQALAERAREKAAAQRAVAVTNVRETVADWHEAGKAVDRATDALVAALNNFGAIGNDLLARIQHSDFANALASLTMATPVVIANRIAGAGWPAKVVPLAPERRVVVGWLPDVDYAVDLYTPPPVIVDADNNA